MRNKLLASAAAIALAVVDGPAYAADEFTTLRGIPAEVMSAQDMASVVGMQNNGTLEIRRVVAGSPVVVVSVSGMPDAVINGLGLLGRGVSDLTLALAGLPSSLSVVTWLCPTPGPGPSC